MPSWNDVCEQRLQAWREAGLARRMRFAESAGARLRLADHGEVLNFAANDYLGLSRHPRVVEAAIRALEDSGAGATASRLLGGSRSIHAALEADLALFKRSQAALVFASGYHAALAAIATLAAPGEPESPGGAVILDRLAHACLLDGARLSGARVRAFKHNDPADLERILTRERGSGLLLVAIESLYSMDGDVAPLREIYARTQAAGALLLVDEAHATGVLGPQGRGVLAEVFEGELPSDVVAMGTLSKALGSQGGFLCASRNVCEVLVHAARAFLFSTGLAPAAAAAAREALRIAQEDEPRRAKLLAHAEFLRSALRTRGWKILGGPGPIVPILTGGEDDAVRLSELLLAKGIWAPAVRYPTVKRGQARLRVSLSAEHTQADVDALVKALEDRKPDIA